MTAANSRTADHPIHPLFLERWSPRAFTDETIERDELLTLIEAARWAPSSYNSQPWRFLYARRGQPEWDRHLALLNEFNQSWAKHAAALLILVSSKTMQGPKGEMPSHSHSLDAGAAWQSLALQAAASGWQAHGMVGFDWDGAATALNVPEGYRVEMAIAIGKVGDKSQLPEALAERETPSDRLRLHETAFEGGFPAA